MVEEPFVRTDSNDATASGTEYDGIAEIRLVIFRVVQLKETMLYAEGLYLEGLLTYPRTETSKYPKSFDVEAALRTHRANDENTSYAQKLLDTIEDTKVRLRHYSGGVDAGDHPPITPTTTSTAYHLRGPAKKVYDLVTPDTASIGPPAATSDHVTVTFRHNSTEGLFTLDKKQVIDPGFTEVCFFLDNN